MSTRKHIFPVTSWNATGELSWLAYRDGYRKAAEALVLKLLDSDGDKNGDWYMRFCMVYPIMFLYRHYIEIEFKDLIALAGMTTLVDMKKMSGHGLKKLWSKVLECVEAVQGKDTRQEFEDACEKVIEYFEQVDPRGDGFRYPKNVKGSAQWDSSFEVDIVKVNSGIKRLDHYCDDLRGELKQMLDPEAEDISDRIYFY
jgi:hypothetical protein